MNSVNRLETIVIYAWKGVPWIQIIIKPRSDEQHEHEHSFEQFAKEK